MKKSIIIASMLLLGILAGNIPSNAQVNVQINIGNQPGWGPTGYDYAQFYYFPDYNFYYDIIKEQYIIYRNSGWYYVNTISNSYRFDPYNAYKVVVNQNKPYLYNKTHKNNYAQYKGQGGQQPMIRDSKESKYYESNGHPNYNGNNGRSNNVHNNNKSVETPKRESSNTKRNNSKKQSSDKDRSSDTKRNNNSRR